MLPDDVFVKTTVDSGQPPGTTFDNTAYSETEPTNTTYHLLTSSVPPGPLYTVRVRYHLMTAKGEVIANDLVPGSWRPGDSVDPTSILDAHWRYGYGGGVAVGTNWTVLTASVSVFDIYYPDTPPVINVKRDIIYVRQPVKLSYPDLLRIAGVSITDAEEHIPLSKLKESGYAAIPWGIVNFPGGIGYQVRLNVHDTPGLAAAYRTISIFVLKESDMIRVPRAGETLPIEYPPRGTAWGLDADGDWVIYIPTATASGSLAGKILLQTGDRLVSIAPLGLAIAGTVFLDSRRRWRARPS